MENFSLKTKASYRRNSTKKTKHLNILIGVAVALLILVLVGNMLGMVSSYLTAPVYALRNWVMESGSSVPLYFASRNELVREIDRLEKELAVHGGRDAAFARVVNENNELRALLGVSESERIVAGVLTRPPFVPYDALLVDRGSRDGIREGAIVYGGGDQAIGRIARVFPESALVTLFSTPGVEVTAYVLGPQVYTTARGQGGGIIRISVPQGVPLTVSDVVILPTLEAGLLGEVIHVESTPTQPEQYGYITFGTPIQSLRLVNVSSRVPERISFDEADEWLHEKTYEDFTLDIPAKFRLDSERATGSVATSTESADPTQSEEE